MRFLPGSARPRLGPLSGPLLGLLLGFLSLPILIPAATDAAGQGLLARGGSADAVPPFGSFDSPICGSKFVIGSIPITGWALDETGTDRVSIFYDRLSPQTYLGDAVFVEGARPDVEQAYPNAPDNRRAGWGYMLLTYLLPNQGNGTYTLAAVAYDQAGNSTVLGTKTIIAENAQAVKPFGAIDTPVSGDPASGPAYRNLGWALTPQPNYLPLCGTTIGVYIDGVYRGHPTYNQYREDIAQLYPGYANSPGAGGFFDLDTTAYQNGVHTILWTATDSGNNADGIGSRYFTIQNMDGSAGPLAAGRQKEIDPARVGVDIFRTAGQIFGLDETGLLGLDLAGLFADGAGAPPYVYAGYHKVGESLRALPVGSTLFPEAGTFHWLPGPAFWGSYELVFTRTGAGGLTEQREIIVQVGG